MVAGIYALHTESDSSYRYVGASKNVDTRLQLHLNRALRERRLPVQLWLVEQSAPVLTLLEQVDDLQQLDERERHWISVLREQGYELLNVTDGGRGGYTLAGKPVRREVADKISKTKTGVSLSAEHVRRAVAGRTQYPQCCVLCLAEFKSLGAFKSHYGSVHKGGNEKRAAHMRQAWASGAYDAAHKKTETI